MNHQDGIPNDWTKNHGVFIDPSEIDKAKLGFAMMAGGKPSYRHLEFMLEIHDAKPDNIIFN